MATPPNYDPDKLCTAVARCVRYQGIRATARHLGWHPSKVSRALDHFQGLDLPDIIALVQAVHGRVSFDLPVTTPLTRGLRGRRDQFDGRDYALPPP